MNVVTLSEFGSIGSLVLDGLGVPCVVVRRFSSLGLSDHRMRFFPERPGFLIQKTIYSQFSQPSTACRNEQIKNYLPCQGLNLSYHLMEVVLSDRNQVQDIHQVLYKTQDEETRRCEAKVLFTGTARVAEQGQAWTRFQILGRLDGRITDDVTWHHDIPK